MPIPLPVIGEFGWGTILNAALSTLDSRTEAVETKTEDLDAGGRLSEEGLSATNVARSWLSFTDPHVGGKGDGATDNTAAWNTAMGLMADGGTLFFPAGVYNISGTTDPVPGSVEIVGTGMSYTSLPDETNPSRGAIIRATAAMARLIQLSPGVGGASGASEAGASIRDITVDANSFANCAVKTVGRRNRMHNLYALRGVVCALDMWGQNNEVTGYSVFDQRGVGDCIRIHESPDNKVFAGANVRSPGTTGAAIHLIADGTVYGGSLASGNLMIQGIHAWTGSNGVQDPAAALVWIELKNGATFHHVNIIGNVLEGCTGPQIRVDVDATSVLRNLCVWGNTFFQGLQLTDVTYPVIELAGNGPIADTVIGPNSIKAGDATHRYKSIVHDSGSGTRGRFLMSGNVGSNIQYPYTVGGSSVLVPEMGQNTVLASGVVTRRTWDSGSATFTGDGVAHTFTIPTTLGTKLRHWQVTPRSAGAAFRNWYADTDGGTQIVVRFVDGAGVAAAPVNGANLVFQWSARE